MIVIVVFKFIIKNDINILIKNLMCIVDEDGL